MYPRLLRFQPVLLNSHGMSLARPCICPLVVARGNDQVSVTTKFEQRNDAGKSESLLCFHDVFVSCGEELRYIAVGTISSRTRRSSVLLS